MTSLRKMPFCKVSRFLFVSLALLTLSLPTTIFAEIVTDTATKWTKRSLNESPQIKLTKKERTWLAKHPVIRLGSAIIPPLGGLNASGEAEGIGPKYAELIARKLGIRFELTIEGNWSEPFERVRRREIDGIPLLIPNEERDAYLNFTRPYTRLSYGFFMMDTAEPASTITDLNGKRVVVLDASYQQDYISKFYPKIVLIPKKTNVEAIEAVLNGVADAIIGPLSSINYIIRTETITGLKMTALLHDLPSLDLTIGIREDLPDLIPILNKAIAAITPQEHVTIAREWMPASIDVAKLSRLALTAEEKAWLKENPVIRLGNSVDWPPFGFINDKGVYSGIAADYFTIIEKLLGIEIKPAKLNSWKETVEAARKGEVDLLDAVVATPQRREFLTFTKPYVSYPVVLFTHKDVEYIANMSVLNGQRVSVIAGSALHDILINNHPEFVIVPAKNARAGLLVVEEREASAFVGNLPTASRVISREGMTDLKVAGETPYRYDLAVGVNKNRPMLASLLQKALDAIPEEKHNEIYRKWMSVTFEHKVDYSRFILPLAVSIFIFIFILFWSRHRQVKKLEQEVASRKITEEMLKRYELIISRSNDVMSLIDRNYVYQAINDSYIRMHGKKRQDIIGHDIPELLGDKFFNGLLKPQLDKCLMGEEIRFQTWVDFAVSGKRYMDVAYYPVADEKGIITGVVVVARDITELKIAEDALKESEASLNQAQKIAHFGSWVWDISNNAITWSDELCRIYGLEHGNIEPSFESFLDLLDEDTQKRVTDAIDKALAGSAEYDIEFQVNLRDGRERIVHAKGAIEWDLDGRPVKMIGTTHDVTERKKSEKAMHESEAQFRLVMDNVPAMIAYLDSDLRYRLVNQRYAENFGLVAEDLIGQHVRQVLGEESFTYARPNMEKVLAGQNVQYEFCPPGRTGDPQWLSASYVPDKNNNGEVIGFYALVININDSKQVEAELHKHQEQLEDLVQQRTKQLSEAKEQAESANSSKSVFLANMSHELRTPLNVILGYAHLLQTDPTIFSAQKEKIKTIERSGQHLLEQISDILDVAKIEAHKVTLTPAPTNIHQFVSYLCDYFFDAAERKGIDFECRVQKGVSPVVIVDDQRLQQVILNLVGNAVVFTNHGSVTLKVESCEPVTTLSADECCLRFTVEDTGIGIPAESFAEIFQPFVQLGHNGGTGLGLNIAQQLVGLMGGEIKLESEVGSGSRFRFDLILPVSEELHQTRHLLKSPPSGYHGKKRKLLVVDDMVDCRNMVRDMLVNLGFQVVTAAKGLDGVILAKDMQPDLILMDLLMPEMDGFQSLSTLRNIPECKSIPVLAMSASVHEEARALNAGFGAFLAKPITHAALVSKLGSLLQLSWIQPEGQDAAKNEMLCPLIDNPEEFNEWIHLGKMRQIINWAAELMSTVPEYTDFAQRVIMFAKDVDEKGLQALIGKTK